MQGRTYVAIDLKSFYASVECVERGLDPLACNLVVADEARTEKTICLAVSPALKAYGIPGRPRLFQVAEQVRATNARRLAQAPGRVFAGASWDSRALQGHPELALDYLVAPPRMALYMEYSRRVYGVYLRYIAPEDIHVYSIDEVFLDVTGYLAAYKRTPEQLAMDMLLAVYRETGITATAGVGSNLYLAKVAMDIQAKRMQADENGVRIATLHEMDYRQLLWGHRPLTDFWRVGRGYAKKLEGVGLYTMGDIARCSLGGPGEYYNEELLYRLFGVNAELLIDHAWGWEPCTMADIKAYKPESRSLGSGQVLASPYPFEKAWLVAREMGEALALSLLEQGLVAEQVALQVGYDRENLADPQRRRAYEGPVCMDHYGRPVPKPAHGHVSLEQPTASARVLVKAVLEIFKQTVDPTLLVRRINLEALRVQTEVSLAQRVGFEQLDMFTDHGAAQRRRAAEAAALQRERQAQQAVLDIRHKYGKNAILKGASLREGATAMERNRQIGGHKA